MEPTIELHDILTPQEHYLIGGTPPLELIKDDSDFYKPVGILSGEFSKDQITTLRSQIKTFNGFAVSRFLKPNQAMLLEDLTDTLETVRDPRVVDKNDADFEPNQILTDEFYREFEAFVVASGVPFEGKLRHYPQAAGPEKKG